MTNSIPLTADLMDKRPQYLWLLTLAYSVAIFTADWFDPRQINVGGLCTGAGSIAFPLTYLLADIITEIYGYKYARLAIWLGLLFYMFFLLYGQFVVYFLSPHSLHQEALKLFLHMNRQIIFATLLSYLATEAVNSYLVAKLKITLGGKYIGFRFILATFMAYIVDEMIYAPIAFYGLILNKNDLFSHMLDSWLFMVLIELFLLPFSIRMAKRIKYIEKLDRYDNQTRFNFFDFSTDYGEENNHHKDAS